MPGILKCSTDVIAILVFSTVITTLAVVQSLLQYYGVDRFEESTNSFPVTFIPALRDDVLIRSLLRLSSGMYPQKTTDGSLVSSAIE